MTVWRNILNELTNSKEVVVPRDHKKGYKRSAVLDFSDKTPRKAGETFTVSARPKQIFRAYSKMMVDSAGLWVVNIEIGGLLQRPQGVQATEAEARYWVDGLHAGGVQYDTANAGVLVQLTFRTNRDLEGFQCGLCGDTIVDEANIGSKMVDVTDYLEAP